MRRLQAGVCGLDAELKDTHTEISSKFGGQFTYQTIYYSQAIIFEIGVRQGFSVFPIFVWSRSMVSGE